MTLLEAKNKILSYLINYPSCSILTEDMIELIGIGKNNDDRAVVAFNAAMKELLELKLVTREERSGICYWLLTTPIKERDQSVVVSFALAEAISNTVNQYTKTNTNVNYTVDKSNITEQDIAMLILIISDISNNLQKESDES